MDQKALNECESLIFQEKINFPQVLNLLADNQVERYCADLVRLEKFYYSFNGQNLTVTIPLKEVPQIGGSFLAEKVREAIRASQTGEIRYPEFLRQIMRAGVVYYDVFVNGKRVIYTGRNGDFHLERFPGAD